MSATESGPTAREREIEYLVENMGLTREYAERVVEDDDLWLQIPEQRFAFLDPEEDVRQWEAAAEFARALAEGFGDSKAINDATQQLLWEMKERAEEALRRARQRKGIEALRNTAFGRVLSELLEKRGLPVTPFKIGKLAEEVGLDGWALINRMASTNVDAGKLDGLADALELDEGERRRLARAYAMEEVAHDV